MKKIVSIKEQTIIGDKGPENVTVGQVLEVSDQLAMNLVSNDDAVYEDALTVPASASSDDETPSAPTKRINIKKVVVDSDE